MKTCLSTTNTSRRQIKAFDVSVHKTIEKKIKQTKKNDCDTCR